MTPETPADAETDAIRRAFAREALATDPGPAPLAEVRRAGLVRRRRRRTATAAALSALGVAVVTAVAVTVGGPTSARPPLPADPAAPPAPVAPAPVPTPPPVRFTAAGERVDAGKGWTVWLTPEGKHWAGPEEYENFRSVIDGNLGGDSGVTHQSSGGPKGAFHSGVYYGTREARRAELTGPGIRPVAATLLELPGRPGWGVWYAHTGPEAYGKELAVTVYDATGGLVAAYPRPHLRG